MSAAVKLISVLISFINVFLGMFGSPKIPSKEKIDMSKFDSTSVFCDEFNGDSLNTDFWTVHYGDSTVRRGGYWDSQMAEVKDGKLHIKTAYMPDGLNGNPAGWYTAGIDTSKSFLQKYGYFECRCIMPKGTGLWSAFWMYCDTVCDINGDGTDGSEIDIMESPYWSDSKLKNSTFHTIHYDGYGDEHKMSNDGKWRISGDPYNEFHTYGVEWNENEYRFYIDGYLTSVTDFGGVSRVPEFLILSVEVDGYDGVVQSTWAGDTIDKNEGGYNFTADFIVDYVKCYQYK